MVPIFLAYWSPGRYGEWLTLSSMVAYLSAFDLGMNAAGGNKLIQEHARGNFAGYRRYQRSALAVYILIAAAGSLLLAAAVVILPIPEWLGLRLTSRREAGSALVLLGFQVLWGIPSGFMTGLYRTVGDLARSQWVANAENFGSLALTLACLLCGRGMVAIASVQLACVLTVMAVILADLKKNYPEIMPGLSGIDLTAVRELIRPSALFGLVIVAEAIRLQGAVLLVSTWLGGAAVAVFVSSRTLCNSVRQIAGTVKSAMWPHVTALEAQQRHSLMRLVHRLWVVSSTALSVSMAAALWFEGPGVIRVWTRGQLPADKILLRLLLAQLVLQSPWMASSLISGASSRHAKLAQAYLWSSILSLGIAWALIGRVGLWALPIGGIAGEALICYHFVTYDTCSILGERYIAFAFRQWLYVGCVTGLALLTAWGAHSLAIGPAVARWAEVGAACVIVVALATWTLGLRASDRIQLKSMIQLARP